MAKKLVVLLDPAHGEETLNKKSPDGIFKEYQWSRKICKKLACRLIDQGYTVHFTNLTQREIGLSKRVDNANTYKPQNNEKKLLLSIHSNNYNNGNWGNASGVELFTSKGKTKSDQFAEIIIKQLMIDFPHIKFRKDITTGDITKEENFTVLMGKDYYAVLLEWLFYDNKSDLIMLQNDNVNDQLVESLIRSIEQIEKTI